MVLFATVAFGTTALFGANAVLTLLTFNCAPATVVPRPVNEMVWNVVLAASSMKFRLAVRKSDAVGLKRTETVHVPPAAIEPAQVVLSILKSLGLAPAR